jgi:tetratricopeptide (TPR) repeat protein
MIRETAVQDIMPASPEQLAGLLTPLLYDPVKTVRIEVARRLAGEMAGFVRASAKDQLQQAIAELEESMLYSADFAASRHNLANLYARTDRPEEAIRQYEKAISIDNRFYPAAASLAVLYSQQGRNSDAERVLRNALDKMPDAYDLAYSLGLLLVEMQQYPEALSWLEQAAAGLPEQSRVHYNLGLLAQFMRHNERAAAALQTALALEPSNLDYQYALADHYLKLGQYAEALPVAEQIVETHPELPVGHQMLEFIRARLQ